MPTARSNNFQKDAMHNANDKKIPAQPLTRELAAELCDQVKRLQQQTRIAESPVAHQILLQAIERGWTPFLHDFVTGNKGAGADLFCDHRSQAGLFQTIMEKFPCAEDYFPLMERSEFERVSQLNPLARKNDVVTPWNRLGFAQRALLIERDALAPNLPSNIGTVNGVFWWVHAMSKALLSLSLGDWRQAGDKPFHGFLTSQRWLALSRDYQPLANALATYLYCLSAADALANPADEHALASMRAANAACSGPSHVFAVPRLRAVAELTLSEALEFDNPEILCSLVRQLGLDPRAQEQEVFSQMPSTPNDCFMRSTKMSREFWGLRKKKPQDKKGLTASTLANDIADMSKGGYSSSPIPTPNKFSPLFSACALRQAHACWDALCADFPPPLHLMAKPTQQIIVSNMAHVAKHRKLCQQRALSVGAGESSKNAMEENLDQRAARARKTIELLPLSPEHRAALLAGDDTHSRGQISGAEAARLFSAEEAIEFSDNNAEALLRAVSGKQTALSIVVRYPWSAHLLAQGAPIAFLREKLPKGSLAAAGDFFSTSRLECALRGLVGAEGVAIIEQDALAASLASCEAISPSRKPRL